MGRSRQATLTGRICLLDRHILKTTKIGEKFRNKYFELNVTLVKHKNNLQLRISYNQGNQQIRHCCLFWQIGEYRKRFIGLFGES